MTAVVAVVGTAVILAAALLTARALVAVLSRHFSRTELDATEMRRRETFAEVMGRFTDGGAS